LTIHEILIIRHAKSSWKYHRLEDNERPLNQRGKRDSHEMGRRLGAHGFIPDLLLSSPTQRSLSTGLIMASQLGVSERLIRLDKRLYNGELQEIMTLLRETPETKRRIMLIGHHTGVPLLVRTLTGQPMAHMPTCAMACVSLDIAAWSKLAPETGRLTFYDYPKKGRV
jgi:phosphohistidine phosphatase